MTTITSLNTKLLLAARALLEHKEITSDHLPLAALWTMGYAHFDTQIAGGFLQNSIAQMQGSLPLQGFALHHWYQCAKNKAAIKPLALSFYSKILDWHRQLYEQYDLEEEGLPYTPDKNMQDPLFLALLVWSNESLIQMGNELQEDVLEIIQWNELTIFSMNEKLWMPERRAYMAYDRAANDFVHIDFMRAFAPMLGEVPTQDQAEQMFKGIQRTYLRSERVNVLEQWLLRRGLLRYDFVELATQIRQRLLQSIKEYGFYENFDLRTGEPLQVSKGQSPLTAILAIDLLKRC